MSDADHGAPDAQPPVETAPAVVGAPSEAAGGLPSLLATMSYARSQTGLLRGAQVLLRTNQAPGFDCPGLRLARARASSAHSSSSARTAPRPSPSEATTRRVDAATSSRAWSVAELAGTVGLLARTAGSAHRTRWSCGRAPSTTSPSPGTTPSR